MEEVKVQVPDEKVQEQERHKRRLLGNSRSVTDFTKVQQIGTGTYGVVFLAKDKTNGKHFALKQIKMAQESDGFPVTSLREVSILSQLGQMDYPHPNIVKLEEVVVGYKQENIFLAFEHCRLDVATLIDLMVTQPQPTGVQAPFFSLSEIKCLMLQLVQSVIHLHENEIVHRDLKLSNLLLSQEGVLKLADFGLARQLCDRAREAPHAEARNQYALSQMTPKVVTLWYRAPEILLRCGEYGKPSDVWAVGCILAELLNKGRPILPGRNEIDQYLQICDLIGKPQSREDWRDFFKLENSDYLLQMSRQRHNQVATRFGQWPDSCIDLLEDLMQWDPAHRLTIQEVLLHPFFTEPPYPATPADFLKYFAFLDKDEARAKPI